MRAREFVSEANGMRNITLNIPITVTIPADGSDPQVGNIKDEPKDGPLVNAVMVSPLQQELELAKQQGGKESAVIDQVLSDDGALSSDEDETPAAPKQNSIRR
jgi:hypothetical protein